MTSFTVLDLHEDGCGEDFWDLQEAAQMGAEPTPERYDTYAVDAYDLFQQVQVNEMMFARASRFVFLEDEGDTLGVASIRRSVSPESVEIYQMAVDPELQGRGYGSELMERTMEEAERFGRERELDMLYMEVCDHPTAVYQEVCDVLQDRGDLKGEAYIRDYCEEAGIEMDELMEENVPMKRLAESHGFDVVDEKMRETCYTRPVDGPGRATDADQSVSV